MAKTNIFILSWSPIRKLHSDPVSHSGDNQPCPAGQCGGHQPGSYKSTPCHYLSDSRPAKPAAPEETLTRATRMPGSSLAPPVYFSKSKQHLSLCFKATPTLFWISWVHLTQDQKLDCSVTSLTQWAQRSDGDRLSPTPPPEPPPLLLLFPLTLSAAKS